MTSNGIVQRTNRRIRPCCKRAIREFPELGDGIATNSATCIRTPMALEPPTCACDLLGGPALVVR